MPNSLEPRHERLAHAREQRRRRRLRDERHHRVVDRRPACDLVLDLAHVTHQLGALDKLIDILIHVCRKRRVGVLVGRALVVRVLPREDLKSEDVQVM